MTAGSTVLAAGSIRCGSGFMPLFQCIPVNINFLFAILKEGARNIVLALADTRYVNKYVIHCTSKFYEISEPMGRDQRQLPEK
jgi:hypothetical protein